jgi:uncharacterized protein YukE
VAASPVVTSPVVSRVVTSRGRVAVVSPAVVSPTTRVIDQNPRLRPGRNEPVYDRNVVETANQLSGLRQARERLPSPPKDPMDDLEKMDWNSDAVKDFALSVGQSGRCLEEAIESFEKAKEKALEGWVGDAKNGFELITRKIKKNLDGQKDDIEQMEKGLDSDTDDYSISKALDTFTGQLLDKAGKLRDESRAAVDVILDGAADDPRRRAAEETVASALEEMQADIEDKISKIPPLQGMIEKHVRSLVHTVVDDQGPH